MTVSTQLDVGTDQMIAYVEDRIGWMIYNNPARRNAISHEMALAIPRILRAFQADEKVVVIVVSGAGDKAFVSGRDISQLSDHRSADEVRDAEAHAAEDLDRVWEEVEKPVIAMIRGYCIGAGLQTAVHTDIRIASESAKFGIPVARLGRGSSAGGVERLVALVGPAFAAEILFSARHLSAEEALRIGLVNRVVSDEDLEETVRALAGAIAKNAPLSLRSIKFSLREARREPAARDLKRAEELYRACMDSEDYVEGKRSFLEKRSPQFKGI